VLVVYTESAANASGSIGNLILLAQDETNTSYSNSSISASVNIVLTAQVSYNEALRSYLDHVNFLQGTTDGEMDIIHTWRDQYEADVVVLIVNDGELCGRAYQIMATANTAFAAVYYDCATGNYSFGHEIGHLQGARHENDPSGTYEHGYVDPNCGWRTIMATVSACADLRVQYWSNPNVTYPPTGQVMGTSTSNDNARKLNETKSTIAGFRPPPPPPTVVLPDGNTFFPNPPPNTHGHRATFVVQNHSDSDQTYSLACFEQPPVWACQPTDNFGTPISTLWVARGAQQNLLVSFSTAGPGTGRVTLDAAAPSGWDQGYYIVIVQ
jgi:hypothetical protein